MTWHSAQLFTSVIKSQDTDMCQWCTGQNRPVHTEEINLTEFHRNIEWFGLQGTSKVIQFQPPTMARDTFHQTRLLRAPSNLALNTSREGAGTASLGNLFQCLTSHIIKNFLLMCSLNLTLFSLEPLPLVLLLCVLVKSPSPSFL